MSQDEADKLIREAEEAHAKRSARGSATKAAPMPAKAEKKAPAKRETAAVAKKPTTKHAPVKKKR